MSTFNEPTFLGGADDPESIEMRLWDYIDGRSTVDEKKFIDELIATNLEWKAKYHELLEVHQLVGGHLELDEPSLRFTKNVMEEIGKYQIAPATKKYINKNIIWGISIFFITMIVGLLVYSLGQVNWSAPSSGNLLPMEVPSYDWGKFFNSTYVQVFLMVNIILGLMLLDMYLGKKKNTWQTNKG